MTPENKRWLMLQILKIYVEYPERTYTMGAIRSKLYKSLKKRQLLQHVSLYEAIDSLIQSGHLKRKLSRNTLQYGIVTAAFEPGPQRVGESQSMQTHLVQSGYSAAEVERERLSPALDLLQKVALQTALKPVGTRTTDIGLNCPRTEEIANEMIKKNKPLTLEEQLAKASEEHRKPVDLSASEDPEKDFG